jgi:hypothetical protein
MFELRLQHRRLSVLQQIKQKERQQQEQMVYVHHGDSSVRPFRARPLNLQAAPKSTRILEAFFEDEFRI